jgi:hypothetical protein
MGTGGYSMTTARTGSSRAISAVSVLGIVMLVASAGCGMRAERTDPEVWSWTGDLKAPGTLHLRNLNGGITVKPSADNAVRITASARWHRGNPKTDLKFNVVSAGSDVTVCVLWTGGTCSATDYSMHTDLWQKFFKARGTDATVDLTIFVPASVQVDASTVNGSVNVLATAPVKARTVNGSITVGTAVGPVDAGNVNGNVDIRMTTLGEGGPVRATTINGSVSAFLPDKLDATVDIAATNGRVGSEFVIAGSSGDAGARTLAGNLGAGGRAVHVSTVNGSAWLRHLNSDGTVGTAASVATPAAATAPIKSTKPLR